MLTYRKLNSIEIIGHSDSDHVECQEDRNSMSSCILTLIGRATSWKSSKKTITSSIMYVEFIVCYEVMGHAIWLKKFVTNLKVMDNIQKLLKLYIDNKPIVCYFYNNKASVIVKHIDIQYYVVKEKV